MKKILFILVILMLSMFVFADGNFDSNQQNVNISTTIEENMQTDVEPVQSICEINDKRCSPEFNAIDICKNEANIDQWVLNTYCNDHERCYESQCVETTCKLGEIRKSPEFNAEDKCVFYDGKIQWVLQRYYEDNTNQEHVCTQEWAPVCGALEVQCITTPCDPIKQTYGNECQAKNAGAKILYKGECEKDPYIYPKQELYSKAKAICSNNEEVEIELNSCETQEYFKKMASEKCQNMSTKCNTSNTNETDSNNETDLNEIDSNNETISKCIGGVVNLVDIKYDESCNKEENTFEEKETNCEQNYDEVRKIKDKCYSEGGELIVSDYSNGCNDYKCISRKDDITVCQTIADIPEEKQTSCEQNGGQFVTRTNENGCLTVVDCLRKETTIQDKNNLSVNKNILTDKASLLSLALKVESLKIEFSKISDKLSAIGDYYTENGNADANNFYNAASLANDAVTKLDSIKELIKTNVESFSEDNAKEVRQLINEVKENILTDILLAILG